MRPFVDPTPTWLMSLEEEKFKYKESPEVWTHKEKTLWGQSQKVPSASQGEKSQEKAKYAENLSWTYSL